MARFREKSCDFHTCKLCPYRSTSIFLMYKHGRLHRKKSKKEEKDFFSCHSKTPELFECQFCGLDTLKVDLKEHVSVIHEEKPVNEELQNILECYQCKNCDFETYSILVLAKHVDDSHVDDSLQLIEVLPTIETQTTSDLHVESVEKPESSEDEDTTEPSEIIYSNDTLAIIETKSTNDLHMVGIDKLESSENRTQSSGIITCNDFLQEISMGNHEGSEETTQPFEVIGSNNMFSIIKIKNTNDLRVASMETLKSSKYMTQPFEVVCSNDDEELLKEIITRKTIAVLTRVDLIESNSFTAQKKYSYSPKKTYCFFCKELRTKISRHFEMMHSNRIEVEEFIHLPKGCSKRKKIIEKLRLLGNFEYNNSKDCQEIITCRRLQVKNSKNHYLPCGNCKGYYSKFSLRQHFRKCTNEKNRRQDILVSSKRLEYIFLEKACKRLKIDILPTLRSGKVAETVINNPFLILFANNLCSKYRSSSNYIRTVLRRLVKFYREMKKMYPQIKLFEEIVDPIYFKGISNAVDKLGKKDPKTGVYASPFSLLHLGIWFRQYVKFYIIHCIRNKNFKERRNAERFLRLMQEVLADANKAVKERKKHLVSA